MNPGYSGVRDYIVNGIKEVVQKYDVDGVQFDDYFYPFNVNSTDVTLDQAAYQQSGSTLSIGAWRTQNINSLVSSVYKMIKETKPNVVFGISRRGISPTISTRAQMSTPGAASPVTSIISARRFIGRTTIRPRRLRRWPKSGRAS